ncbi:MAG: hypothetical protein M3Q33_14905 [Acidobacteriota bacterium]|nr:hypothetical protein [Acidobacteriota bacterium]
MSDFAPPSLSYLLIITGVIAFVCLVVGFAASSDNLSAIQSWILTVFLILFAVFSVVASVWLILRELRRAAVGRDNRDFNWEVSSPAKQQSKLNSEVSEIAAILKLPDEQLSDLLSAYIVAEDLALRQVQQEAKQPIARHLSIGNTEFNAILLKQDIITCIEVIFLVTPDVSQAKINEMLKKIELVKKTFSQNKREAKIRLLLVLVTQLDQAEEARLRSSLVKKFAATPVDVDIRLLDFEGLQKIYAMD